eukprot:4286213-Amphidinium_carterae.1
MERLKTKRSTRKHLKTRTEILSNALSSSTRHQYENESYSGETTRSTRRTSRKKHGREKYYENMQRK